ncbi:MAG: cytidine deaminase [Deltaproteobacteria bacterium]|nr:cytidine deaminase [Deltaproteobacteria bacterium]
MGSTISDSDLKSLIDAAKNAASNSYSPYSRFAVGAAILCENGEVYSGCNVENAAYGSANCAERSAIFTAISAGCREVRVVVIYTPTESPAAPCGACRQVINEFGPDAEIVSTCKTEKVIRSRLSDLLPHAFGPKNLET